MKNFLYNYFGGLELLLSDDLISYFAYFTTILVQVAFLWAFKVSNALFFTILLILSIVNVFIGAFWKSYVEGSKAEIIQSVAFSGAIVVLFIVGCKASFVTSLLLFAIPLIVTRLWITIREFQNTEFLGYNPNSMTMKISKLFHNKIIYILSYVITMLIPICLLVVFTAMTGLPTYLKILLPLLYIFISPYIGLMEDEIATCSIFELMVPEGYQIEQEYQKMRQTKDKEPEATDYDD